MRHMILALVVLAFTAVGAKAAPWAFVEQDGRSTALEGEVHLKRKPFQLVFEGAASDQYVLVAAYDIDELQDRLTRQRDDAKAGKDSPSVFGGAFMAAVDTDPTKADYLIVNDRGLFGIDQFTTQHWLDDKQGHCFQTLIKIGGARVRASRQINTILVNRGFRKDGLEVRTSEMSSGVVYMFVGRRSEKATTVQNLTGVVLVFD